VSAAGDGSLPGWRIDRGVIALTGDWLARTGPIPVVTDSPLPAGAVPLRFDSQGLGRWDSALIAFLWDMKQAAAISGRTLDTIGLPPAAGKLLGLLPDRLAPPEPRHGHQFQPFNWIGRQTLESMHELGVVSALFGSTLAGAFRVPRGRARMRGTDLAANMRDAGPAALIIVSVVNFLTGAILAIVGAVQLRKFAADMYVANLVGLALVREMAALMTAIVMAGRTGGAYAARIATMQGNEEIDALTVLGIPVPDYIVLSAVLALVFAMPFLYLYGCLIGMVGGFVVAIGMLNVTGPGYLNQTLNAVAFGQFAFGFFKSIVFALLIGVTSCRIGLRAGRSAAGVGVAATRAVVAGIVGVIAVDALFAVAANAFGI
jgi:phospholipid/cholesterol/gamma-HCH transport system permease protein